jgi:hypothetical protein
VTPQPRIVAFGSPLVLRPALRVAAALGAAVFAEEDAEQLPAHLGRVDPHVVLWEHTPERRALVAKVLESFPDLRIVLLAEPSPPADLDALLGEPWFHHLLGLGAPWFMEELTATLARLLGRPSVGVAGFLPWGSRVVSVQITRSGDKDLVFPRLEALLSDLGIRGRLVARLIDVADELLMNAIYDAPVDRMTGQPLYTSRRRAEPITLAAGDQPTFSFGTDGQKLVLGITDPFGGLTADTVKRYLAKGLRRGQDQIDQKDGGAGLGLFLMLEGLNGLHFLVDPGRRTEVVGMLNVRGSMREAASTSKSLTILVKKR